MLIRLSESDKIQELHSALQNQKSVLIEDLWNTPKAFIAALAQAATGKHVLILTGANQEEVKLYHNFAAFTDRPVVDFPAWEALPTENIPPSPDIVGERYQILRQISDSSDPYIILTGLQACLQKLIPSDRFDHLYLSLKVGDTISFETLTKRLEEMGYRKMSVASDKGEYAVRGGIIDVFPVSSPDPYRFEFWGDEIESLRIYDPVGQKSVRHLKEVSIAPAQELELLQKSSQQVSLLDYLGPNTLIIFDDLLSLEDRYASLVNLGGKNSPSFLSIEDFLELIGPLQKIYWSQQPLEELSEVRVLSGPSRGFYSDQAPIHELSFQMFNREISSWRWNHPFLTIAENFLSESQEQEENIFEVLRKLQNDTSPLTIVCPTELEESNFHKKIQDMGIHLPAHTVFCIGYLSSGFVVRDTKQVILPINEYSKRIKIRRQKQRSTYHTVPAETYSLTPGEMVVHFHNGIGKFLGIEKKPNHQGTLTEFFLIEYADNAKLYVPMNQAHLVSKYIGSDEELPKMHTLGSARWKKSKENTERAILEYANDLLDLYAKREIRGGFKFDEDSPDLLTFEEEFPYVETEDQLIAIKDIKDDMKSPKPMDRLVCGDVGYGKTEVAMRAAFKAVVDGKKQVAILVPTTVLAMQHYENFVERFANFPINIAVLSRFRSTKEIREAIDGASKGTVDILIGTHRIVSEDVVFKDLGLVIIDEEQRFGVKAKEHLKKIKLGVDCLTLSATPIPRTLYMSLVGARDMSVISTPPQDRLPITTVITEPNELVLKNALLRELSRDGQAYVVHNRVESIFEFANRIRMLLPQAKIGVVHGQMNSDDIDSVFHAFKSGQADILVATSIIENGIDIPNANTILIDRADRFGMADLYQLRGRVGRWNRRAYAYFLVPNLRTMPEIVRKRLQALAESTGYGGGMKVAMRDLENRGAGNILGLEQSGHVSAIGFHLYCKLLKKAIQALQGKIPAGLTETKMEFLIDARLPEDYVNATNLRMEIYQRLGDAITWEDVDQIWEELKDRFGPPPEPVEWLYRATRIRVFASQKGVTSLKQEQATLSLEQKKGKDVIHRKFFLPKAKSPEDFEQKILVHLKNL